jgi:hypothetical protein
VSAGTAMLGALAILRWYPREASMPLAVDDAPISR